LFVEEGRRRRTWQLMTVVDEPLVQNVVKASSVSTSSAAAAAASATGGSSPAGSPVTRRTGPRILPSILGRFTSAHRSASSDRLRRGAGGSQRRTESSENIAIAGGGGGVSVSSSPGSPASVGAPASPSRHWEARLMVWDSRSALDASAGPGGDPAAGGGCPAGDDDAATSPASTGPSSDGSCRLQPWRTDAGHHQQQQPDWMMMMFDTTSSGQNSRRSSTATVNSDAPNP